MSRFFIQNFETLKYRAMKFNTDTMSEKIYKKDTRRIFKNGPSSVVISIPREFVERHSLKPGDSVEVIWDGYLYVIPVTQERIRDELRSFARERGIVKGREVDSNGEDRESR